MTSIGNGVFYNRKNLTSVTIPDSVTSIGKNAFRDCKNLTSVTIPDSVTSIGNNAFEGCKSLRSIIIPDGVTSIDYGTFESCENLTNITIPDSVTSIHDAFEGTAWYNNHPDGFVYAGKVIYKYKGTAEHIEYVIEKLENTPNKIHNMRAYLLTVLYNSIDTLDTDSLYGN